MSKTRKLQDFAEDFSPSQSDDMEVLPQGDGTPSEMLKAAKQMTASADTITRHAETMGLAVDGIGRYLLNEDGTVRDFTNKELMDETAKKVDAGLKQMNANAENIHNRIEQFPTHIEHKLAPSSILVMDDFNENMRFQRLMFIIAVVVIALFAGYTAFRYFDVAKKSEEMSQWYEENNEAVLFGRYLRVNENDRWRFWHDKWVNDPGLKEDMNDYFLIEELKENRKK